MTAQSNYMCSPEAGLVNYQTQYAIKWRT